MLAGVDVVSRPGHLPRFCDHATIPLWTTHNLSLSTTSYFRDDLDPRLGDRDDDLIAAIRGYLRCAAAD